MKLRITNLNMSYGEVELFRDFNITFPEETITCILGPSGCGKTTLLNIIGKLRKPESGTFEGFENKVCSYIFQEDRLLPWKTVRGNIEFVLGDELTAGEKDEQVSRLIRLVELDGFAGYYPSKLSGGMRQRVSIARAFASRSDIILMDEPLKGLDLALKQNMIKWFSRLWRADRRTVIFVTHDVDEALLLGREIFVLSRPPVNIVAHETIDEPAGARSLQSDQIKKMENILIDKLMSPGSAH